MTAPQTLLNKIQKAHEMNNENAALLTVITPEAIMRPLLHQTAQKVTEQAFKNAVQSWEIIDSVAETYPFIYGKIAEHLLPHDKVMFLDMMQHSYSGALICALAVSDTADLLCYFGLWDRKTYSVYQIGRQQVKNKERENGISAFQELLRKKVLPHKNICPVMLENAASDRFDEVCDYLKEKGYFIAPDYQMKEIFNEMRDQLHLIKQLNVVYEEKKYPLDNYLPPVTDWLSLPPKEAEKTVVYNTAMIAGQNIIEEKCQSIYSLAMDIMNDSLLKNAALLAQTAVEKNPEKGLRTFLMTTDLASLYSPDLTLLNEKEKNKRTALLIDETRVYLSQYSTDHEWNQELVKWYDACSLGYRGSLTQEPEVIVKHNIKKPNRDIQKGRGDE